MVIIFSDLSIAESYRVNIRPETKSIDSFSRGDLIAIKIELELPGSDYDLKKILPKFIKNTRNKVIGPLFITNIIEVGRSEYNKSVFVMEATAVIYSDSNQRKIIINITGHSILININIKNKIIPTMIDNKSKITVYDIDSVKNSNAIYVLVVLIMFAIIIFVVYKKRKELLESRKALYNKKLLIDSIRSAHSRFDFESLYANRSEILEALQLNESYCDDLFILINEKQYLKTWNKELLEEVLSKKNYVLQKINNG